MSNARLKLVVYLCFFFSGIAGLIYEVLWARYLSLIFGNTAYAHTLVLSMFMGGLALGSFALGKVVDKVENRLAFYAWVEIGIAAFCILTPQMLVFSKPLYLTIAKHFSINSFGIVIIKFIIGALVMLPPTILMGGTLPILSKSLVSSLAERGKVIASLYYINSFGAVMGTFLAGFYLIQKFGLAFSVTVAALINFAVGFAVLILAKTYEASQEKLQGGTEASLTGHEATVEESSISQDILVISLISIFLSGFVAMLYEVVWIRLLSMVLGSSTYSFSLMLAAFISGITIGSYIISKRMPRSDRTFLAFGLCELAIGLLLLFSLPFYEKLPYLFLNLSLIFSRKPETFMFYEASKFLFSFLIMLPPTIFLGMTLPLVSKIAANKLEFLGQKVGGVLSANTAGNILGALVSGLILVPVLGLKNTLELGVAINLIIGLVILFRVNELSMRNKVVACLLCCTVFIGYKVVVPDWNPANFSAQIFRFRRSPEEFREFLKRVQKKDILFYEDGLGSTVSVIKFDDGGLVLYVNGKADASTGRDMTTQMLCAHLPLLLKPQAEDVFILGLGSGVTCGSALLHPIRHLDVVEISPSVVKANKYFAPFTYNALQDKRLHMYVEDAKTFLERTDKSYDIIINEPSNPWMSGVGDLFSTEFFTDCLHRLKDDGLVVQWVQAYEMDDTTFEMIFRTFASVFPEVTIWSTGVTDILLVGSKHKIGIDTSLLEKRMSEKQVRADLEKINMRDPFTFLTLQLASNKTARDAVVPEGPINSDYFPVLEYKAPLALYTGSTSMNFIKDLDERRLPLRKTNLFIKRYLEENRISQDNYRNLYDFMIRDKAHYNIELFPALVRKWYAKYPKDRDAILAYATYNIGTLDNALRATEYLVQSDKSFNTMDFYAGLIMSKYFTLRSFLTQEVFIKTVEQLKECADISEGGKAKFYYLLGKVFSSARDYKASINYYTKAEKLITSEQDAKLLDMQYLDLLNEIGYTYLKDGNLPMAVEYIQKVLAVDSTNVRAQAILQLIGFKLKFQQAKDQAR